MGMTLNAKFSNVLLVPTPDVAAHICAHVVTAHMLHLKARKLAFSTCLRTEMSFCSCPPQKKLMCISSLATLRRSMEVALTVKPLWFCFTDCKAEHFLLLFSSPVVYLDELLLMMN